MENENSVDKEYDNQNDEQNAQQPNAAKQPKWKVILKKVAVIASIVLASLISLFLLLYAILGIIGAASYGEARKLREYVCKIPEINSGYAPQGIGYSAEEDLYILSGYDGKNRTVLYSVKNDKYTRLYVAGSDGKDLIGHAGGVTIAKDNVYIANGSTLTRYSLKELLSSDDKPTSPKDVTIVDNTAAFVFSDDNAIYVGEFYRAGNYETDKAHYYTTPCGAENKAIVSKYPLNEKGEISAEYPEYCISIPGLVQGVAVNDGKFILSRSYGLKNSKLEYYSAPKLADKKITLSFFGTEKTPTVPLYYLDDTLKEKTIILPAFSEDLTIANGKVVVTNESACNKYIVGKLFGANKVYAYPLSFE